MAADPHETYSQSLAARRGEIAALEARHRTLGYWRLGVALAGCGLAWMALGERAVSAAWILGPLAAFIALIAFHERLLRLAERRRRAARYFERALARLDGGWAGAGETGDRYLDPAHPYAQDLDLFGRGSLFELLCSARTHVGEDTLARWLLAPAAPETVRARQQAVEELRERLDLREALAVVAEEARTGVDPVGLAAWGEGQGPALDTRKMLMQVRVLAALGVLAAAAAIALAAWSAGALPLTGRAAALLRDGLVVVLVVNGSFLYTRHKLLSAVVSAVERAAHELGLLSEVLLTLERETFRSPLLTALRASLDSEGGPPSRQLARLKRLVEYLDSRDNVFVRVAEVFILWTPHWALQVEDWRRRSGPAVRRWLHAMGEIEALSSLASHAFEHPADAFPEVSESATPWLVAEQVAHPLIPESRAVRNDVSLGSPRPRDAVTEPRASASGPGGATSGGLTDIPRARVSAAGPAGEPGGATSGGLTDTPRARVSAAGPAGEPGGATSGGPTDVPRARVSAAGPAGEPGGANSGGPTDVPRARVSAAGPAGEPGGATSGGPTDVPRARVSAAGPAGEPGGATSGGLTDIPRARVSAAGPAGEPGGATSGGPTDIPRARVSAAGPAGEPGGAARLLVVSGSNMSGKSTLLRTLGTNVVLAQAGAPVRARRMTLAPMAVGASIRVVDSLQGGVSRFYAELLRLRQIVDLTAGPLPVLFLIDEFFHGTNSHDRRIGAEALVRGLLRRGAFGLVTTHDLALAEIVDSLHGQGANVHFEDRIENGRIRFDYLMRPGVVRKSNALELMRSVGLDT